MPYLAFDIETVINDEALTLYNTKEYKPDPAYAPDAEPPVKITDLKTAELRETRLREWRETNVYKAQQSVYAQRDKDIQKAPLQWWTGKIICICAIDMVSGAQHCFRGDDEALLLRNFFRVIEVYYPNHTLVGKHSEEFDRPYVVGRALRHDLGLPCQFQPEHEVTDVNHYFSRSKSCGQVTSLENYAFGLQIEGKTGNGSQVAEWYTLAKAGDMTAWDKISTYCYHDTSLVTEIVRRAEKRFTSHELSPDVTGTF